MIAEKLQPEADFDGFIQSETMSTTTESSSSDKPQVERKMRKLRSIIKLSRIPSTRKGRSTSTPYRTKLSGYTASSEQSTPIETLSDASPNHINAMTSSENLQVLPTVESGFKLLRSVSRKSSMKFRRPQQMKKSSGGTDLNNKKVKKSSRKEANSQDMNKDHLQASSCYSGSSFDSSDQDKNISAGNKSVRVVRTSSLGPMKVLTKMASLRSKRTNKCSEISSVSDPNVERDTCSSTLKSSKFPEVKPGGKESDGTVISNVCRYSYCSLHGHRHDDKPPPLKRFVSIRRRAAKNQKSLRSDPKSSGKANHSGNRKKRVQAEKRVLDGDLGVADEQTTVDIREIPSVSGTQGGDLVDLGEAVPVEASYPSHEENPQRSNHRVEVEQQSPGTFQVFKDIDVDCSGIGGQQKAIKIEETERINNEGRLEGVEFNSQEIGDTTQINNLHCNASVSMGEESLRDIDEDIASSSNSEEFEGHSGNGVENLETVSTGDSCELLNSLVSTAPVTVEESPSAILDKNEGSDLDSGILQHADPMVATSSMDVASKKDMENQKHFTFWKLIYRQMATGLDSEPETQTPRPGMKSEEQAEQARSIEDYEASNQKLEFSQSDAIKLVQQAFDKILSEIPDNSSDDQSIVNEKTSDQEFLLQEQDEGKELSISTSSNPIEDCTIHDREEQKLQTDEEIASEEVKATPGESLKSGKQMPNSWSNLKKILILRRFVKSLEKVKKLKPKPIRYLPPAKDPEAENIQLRPQTEKERKNADEWMLDHALRQVISTLAPSQKRKVAMLVQAFETVIPAENRDEIRPNAAASSPTTSVHAYNESPVNSGDSTENENGSEITPGNPLYSEMHSTVDRDQFSESNIAYQPDSKETSLLCSCDEQPLCIAGSERSGTYMKKEDNGAVDDNNGNEVSTVELSFSELEEARQAGKSFTDEDGIRTCHDKIFPVHELNQRNSKEEISVHSSEVCNVGSGIGIKKMDLESNDLSVSPDQVPDTPECPAEVGEGAQPTYKFLRSKLEQSESNFTANISKSERQKYTRLWYLIYKHMVSESATENGSQPQADWEVQSDDASQRPKENNADCQGSFAADMIENYSAGHNNEIIKLVEEAIDEIPLPETQDDTSDNQSVIGDVILDQEFPEQKHGQEEVKIISSSTDSAKENSEEAKTIRAELGSTLNSKEKVPSSENGNAKMEAKGGTEEGNKSKKRVLRNWSNLKKLVLLRRFVKALEKVREFNPRGPRYLPEDPAPEPEKVLLRHQNMGDRRNAEEWMLDYALQQVVAKLTPERKRRVGLLVEAFETIIPTIS